MSFTFTVSRKDFKDYFRCPKKLALKVMGFKAREIKRKQQFVHPAYEIGLSGEKLTEQILEIIASIQAEKSGEKVEVLAKREEKERQIIQEVSKYGFSLDFERSEVGKLGKELVRSTVGKAFETRISFESLLEQYKRRIMQETSRKFTTLLGDLYNKLPKINSVYKPVLKNRDICSLGYPDFQIDSEQGQILIEVKNWANMNTGLKEGKLDLLYYNSLLADKILGASTHLSEKLPIPIKSLLVIPRYGLVKEVNDPIRNYREIAVEIWKIKKAAIVEEKLPYVRPDPTICKRCGFKKYCQEGESLEKAKPLPLIHAIAYQEAEKELEKLRRETLKLPEGFWHAYFTLKKEAESGDTKASEKTKFLEEYRIQRSQYLREKEIETLFKATSNEFEEWGGITTLKNHYLKISRTASQLFPRIEDKVEEIIRIARRKWRI